MIKELRESVNRENLLKWIEALESGNYQQGQSALALETSDQDFSFCCLGVGCEVAEIQKHFDSDYVITYYPNAIVSPPSKFYEWLEISDITSSRYSNFEDILVQMNDNRRRSFTFIARFLRKAFGV